MTLQNLISLLVLSIGMGVVADETGAAARFSVRQRAGGGWTLVRPDGTDVFLTAVNHLSSFKCMDTDTSCKVTDLMTNRFNGNWSALAEAFIADLKKWGFSAAGYGQAEYGLRGQPTFGGRSGWEQYPYFPHYWEEHGSPDGPGGFYISDVFEPSFVTTTDQQFEAVASRVRATAEGASNAVGYYFNDIPIWGRAGPYKRKGPPAWTSYMRGLNASAPGKSAYVSWLEDRYGGTTSGLQQVCRVYNVVPPAKSWKDLMAYSFGSVNNGSEAVVQDDTAFLGVVADRIYGVASAAVRKHDPTALVFGDKFIQIDMPQPVLDAAAKHFDVLSIQPQPFSFTDSAMLQQNVADLVAVARKLDMPLMIADQATHYQDPYHTKHAEFPDRCLEQHGNPCCEDEITAGNLYEEYLDSLNASGVVVGFARCQYIDRRFCWTCNTTKQGLLHYDGTPRPYLTAAVARANRKYLTTPP